MCIFSGTRPTAPLHVAGTQIYARIDAARQSAARQCVVYSMHLAASDDVAMILPVPVVPGSGDDAATFVDLSEHPKLFDDLRSLFDVPAQSFSKGAPRPAPLDLALTLEVHEVGAFVASYVPSIPDFARLDPRFRLPDAVWSKLPQYADWGFAVFQLRKGDARVHPMALHFPTRDPSRVFFPTVHVHDGEVHPRAAFNHQLYWQGEAATSPPDETSWLAYGPAGAGKSKGLVLAGHVKRRTIRGEHDNRDVWI